jgi:cellulose synthase/poly-beta-1,6-N-acetylglucosamine synthase-like glycosyltransferase
MAAKGDIVATTDADSILPRNWIEMLAKDFLDPKIVQVYGPVYPIEEGIRNRISLILINTFSRIGYYSRTFYYTLGCNTAFHKEAFIKAGMYRCIDAGDDLEIAMRMLDLGKISFDGRLKVGFSMRRYQKFGTLQSLYEWLYIVTQGGDTEKYSYTRKKYK